jgi:two-component system invasion response regulator UvrY
MGIFYKPDISDSRGFSDTLHQAFKALSMGLPYVSPSVLNAIRSAASAGNYRFGCTLTTEEWDVLNHVIRGLTDKEIANRIGQSIKTVERRKGSMRRKLGARTTSELVAYIVNSGIRKSSDRG